MSVISAPQLLVIDNEDSFTGSLVQYTRSLGWAVRVVRAAAASPADWAGVDRILLSPGPGRPEEHPINAEALRSGLPVFGVCLGMQALALALGAEVVLARQVVHGRTSPVHHLEEGCFAGLPNPLRCTRYHSLAVRRATLPACLQVTAWTSDGEIMGLRHRTLSLEGVQFHPESVRSERGLDLLRNALGGAAPQYSQTPASVAIASSR